MKKSPAQILEIFYPALSYEANTQADSSTFPPTMAVTISAGVAYCSDDEHMVKLTLRQDSVAENIPYTVSLEAYAVFTFDKEYAREFYGSNVVPSLSLNVASIVLSSVREMLANATSRGPYGSAFIEGVVLDLENVEITFEEDLNEMIPRIFGLMTPQKKVTKSSSGSGKGKRKKANS